MIERLEVESLAYGGDGVARLADGRAAFVSLACPGDVVDAEITEDRARFVRARVTNVVEASPDRVDPPCPYFGRCGGCTWQHVSADAQRHAKRQALVDALSRIGRVDGADAIVAPTVASADQYGYRNKVELVTDTTSGRIHLGFHRPGSVEVVPVDACLLLPKRAVKTPRALAGALRYASGASDLGIVRVGIRVATHTKDLEVALWSAPGPFPRGPVAKTLGSTLAMTSLVRVLVRGEAKERDIAGVEVLAGRGMWRERLAGMSYAISAPSFFQVNSRAAEQLVAATLEALSADGTDRVLDLFAGAGTFTLPLAERAGEVVAVESAGSAVRDLRRNLDEAGLYADVVGGDASRELPALGRFDAVLVDPPRAGLTPEADDALRGTGARTVAYVSCDPATLARDAARLAEAGLSLERAVPFDLFPQSFHVETLAVFTSTGRA